LVFARRAQKPEATMFEIGFLAARGWVRRQRALLEFALASLSRRPGKTIVLGAVLALIAFLLASLAFVRASVRLEAAAMLRDAPDLIVQRIVAGRQEVVPEVAVAALRALPGVSHAQGRLWGYYYDAAAGANYTLVVPPASPPRPGETAIGAGISRSREGYSRDVLAFRSYRGEPVLFAVKAVLPERADLVAGDVMVVSEPDFRALLALPAGVVNDIAVQLAPGADAAAVRRSAAGALPGARVVTRQELLATADAFLDWRRGLAAVLLLAMALALLIVAADKPSALSVEEQREIGTLRALGWSRTDVLVAKAWESLAVSVVALLIGMFAAYAHVYLGRAAVFAPVLRGWAVLAPRLDLAPSLDIPFLAAVASSIIVLPALGTLVASHRPASGDPDAVIRE
jgi:predicted lysophospholipase L1 biosynthesis ABC-type transport system permease subunit